MEFEKKKITIVVEGYLSRVKNDTVGGREIHQELSGN